MNSIVGVFEPESSKILLHLTPYCVCCSFCCAELVGIIHSLESAFRHHVRFLPESMNAGLGLLEVHPLVGEGVWVGSHDT
jgi:hypothetical protein